MEAIATLDTLHEQLCKAQQDCPETEHVTREKEQHKLNEVAEHTKKAIEWLQQHIDNFVVFLASTLATLGNSSMCNTTVAAASPLLFVPQISPIQSPCLSSSSPVDVSINNTTASNSTHVASVPETQNNTTPTLHTMELEYYLNAYNYPKDK